MHVTIHGFGSNRNKLETTLSKPKPTNDVNRWFFKMMYMNALCASCGNSNDDDDDDNNDLQTT